MVLVNGKQLPYIQKVKKTKLVNYKVLIFHHSLGMLYSSFTPYLGFKPNEGEYKVMGLSLHMVIQLTIKNNLKS